MKQRTKLAALRDKVWNRVYISCARSLFALCRRLHGGVCWVSAGPVRLPVFDDEDQQIAQYSLYGDFWWRFESGVVAKHVPKGGVVLDVGANLGFLSALFSSLVGEQGRVIAFEPSIEAFKKLSAVIVQNRIHNIETEQAGCGSESTEMTLYSPAFSGNATLRPEEFHGAGEMHESKVRIVRLDDFFTVKEEGAEDKSTIEEKKTLSRLDFVKIDTEGFEDEVLLGMRGLLDRFRPVLYVELCAQFRASSERAIGLLRELGYRFEPEIDLDSSENGENYLCIPMVK